MFQLELFLFVEVLVIRKFMAKDFDRRGEGYCSLIFTFGLIFAFGVVYYTSGCNTTLSGQCQGFNLVHATPAHFRVIPKTCKHCVREGANSHCYEWEYYECFQSKV